MKFKKVVKINQKDFPNYDFFKKGSSLKLKKENLFNLSMDRRHYLNTTDKKELYKKVEDFFFTVFPKLVLDTINRGETEFIIDEKYLLEVIKDVSKSSELKNLPLSFLIEIIEKNTDLDVKKGFDWIVISWSFVQKRG